MSITADTYLKYHATKQSHTWTDPLAGILNNINNNPDAYGNAYANSKNSHSAQYNHPTNNNQKGEAMDMEQNSIVANNRQKQENTNTPKSKGTLSQDSKVIKTRSG